MVVDVPSPFSISGMGATLFFACWRVVYGHVRGNSKERDVLRMTYVTRVAVDDVLTLDGAVVRGSVSVARHDG